MNSNEYGIKEIIIPKIQRAYAQGRKDNHATKTRERFLQHIKGKLSQDETLTLDFIYGNVNKETGQLIPLDGQQRLTTLWLLHWFAGIKESNVIDLNILKGFRYETRYSARDFILKLVDLKIHFDDIKEKRLSELITDQGWFPLDWNNDPTICSMLVMIDEIHNYFNDIDNLWNKLDNINFYFKNIEEMELTDDIYIKMNSRGKPLTDFEHVKAELLKTLRDNSKDNADWEIIAKRIGLKFDTQWTDLLWEYRDKNNNIDDLFDRYMLLIFQLIIYRNNDSVTNYRKYSNFDFVSTLFKTENALENIDFFEKAFDCWVNIIKTKDCTISEFCKSFLSETHQDGKSIPLYPENLDILGTNLKPAENSNQRQLLVSLYTFIVYLINYNNVSEEDFRRRLRIILNLQKNSSNEVVDNPKADAGNRIPAILKQVESIILNGEILKEGLEHNFNVNQLDEEIVKLEFTKGNEHLASKLFRFEDYKLLEGRIAILGIENHYLYEKFINLYENCNYDLIDRALLSLENYWQQNKNNSKIIQLGAGNKESTLCQKAWKELFHPSNNTLNFENTQNAILQLLHNYDNINDSILANIAESYIEKCQQDKLYPWKYYYIKYPDFRNNRSGKYSLTDGYVLIAFFAEKKLSQKAYDCFLKASGRKVQDIYDLYLDDINYIRSCPNGFIRCANNQTLELFVEVHQENGIDTEDRVELLKTKLSTDSKD